MRLITSSVIAFIVMLSGSVLTAKAPMSGDHTATSDPNKVICRTQDIIGSRLGSIRTCHTAQEWQQVEREERMTVDRVQANKPYQN